MEQIEFLDKKVFKGLEKLNDGFEGESVPFFSESDFEIVLERAEYFGIGIYGIEPWLDGELYDVITHENLKKKATDPQWYKKAFQTFKSRQPGLLYSATYKVSPKLLARDI
ncbi:hypothetical protein [Fluviicola sp.]|uniref:hypothetical protein n=1 Tax=Fluviicola sp. TaxID=1917219 RepID=UPI0031D6DD13